MSVYLANAVALPVQHRVQHTANRVRETRENVAGNEFFCMLVLRTSNNLLICNVAGETDPLSLWRLFKSRGFSTHLLMLWHMC